MERFEGVARRELFELIPDGYLRTDLNGIIQETNHTVEGMFNLPKKLLVGQNLNSFISTEEQHAFQMELATLAKSFDPQRAIFQDWEVRLEPHESASYKIAVRVSVVYQSDDKSNVQKPIGLHWFIRDITRRTRAEQALEEVHVLLEKTFASLEEVVLVIDLESQTILACNPAVGPLFGYATDELVNCCTEVLFDNADGYAEYVRQLLESLEGNGIFHTETRLRRKDGRVIDAEHMVTRISEQGQRVRLVNVIRDISERKHAEALAQQNYDRAVALATISRAIVETGPDYLAVLHVLTCKIAEIIGDACIIRLLSEDGTRLEPAAYHHPDNQALEYLRMMLQGMSDRVDESLAGRVLRANQTKLIGQAELESNRHFIPEGDLFAERIGIASALIVPLHVQEKVIGTLALLRDAGRPEYTFEDRALLQILADQAALAITNSRLYQELGKALQEEKATHLQLLQAEKHMAMSRMIASVAHELNNPIQTIRNCLYLTQQDVPPDSNIHEYLDMAVSETQRVANLVANLRGVYRPGQAEEMVVVDLVKVLEEVKLLLEPHLQHERVVWNQSTQVGKVLVKGIPNQLKQVFLNICLNAIEAMQPKGGSLMVGLCIPLNSRQVIVSFTDDGSGISPQDLTKLFDPFFTTKDTGTGLGLSISYDIVRSHDGQIHVDSRLGEGATFEIQLPIANYE